MYDRTNKAGFLYNALNYKSKVKRKAAKPLVVISEADTYTDEDKEEVLKYLKRCVPSKQRKEVENKMKESNELRRDIILNEFWRYRGCWNFYFVLPELVSKILFEKKCSKFRDYIYLNSFADF